MADQFRLDWNGEAAKAKAKQLAYQALVRIVLAVTRQAKLLLSVPGTGRNGGKGGGTKKAKATAFKKHSMDLTKEDLPALGKALRGKKKGVPFRGINPSDLTPAHLANPHGKKAKATGSGSGGVTHSAPGEPPFKQTGRLRGSVTYEIDEATSTARVGTNLDYGRHLELGTKKGLLARPWLRRAVDDCKGLITAILGSLKGF